MRIVQLRTFLLLACAPLLLLAGCIDVFFDPADPDPDPVVDPPISVAQQRFMDDVYPIISNHCAACHSEATGGTRGFVGKDPVEGYTRILAFPAVVGDFTPSAPIATIAVTGHMGVTYTPAERTAILGWLDAELADRGGPPASAVETAIRTWSGCLDFGDFTAVGMAPAWSSLTSSNGACTSCHTPGGTVLVTPDAPQFFQLITTRRAHLLGFFTIDVTAGTGAAKIITNSSRFLSVGTQQTPYTQHPAFDFAGSAARKALQDLYTATEQRRLNATCAPPRLVD